MTSNFKKNNMKKAILVMMVFLSINAMAQRTQIGSAIEPPAESGMQTFPLFYVDTATNSYYARAGKREPWIYNLHAPVPIYDTVTVTVHDTVYIGQTIYDTLYVTQTIDQFLVPENFGATNSNALLPSGMTPDTYAWQKCIDIAAVTGQAIYGSGKNYFINKDLIIPLNIKDGFYINGNWSHIFLTADNGLFKRENPSNNTVANVYMKTIMIEKFTVNGNGKNTVLDINSTFQGKFYNMAINNIKLFGKFRFCLQGAVDNVIVSNYKKFAQVTVGDWLGTSAADGTSGSNSFSITNCRMWGTADTAVYIYGSSGFIGDNIIVEGDKVKIAFCWNAEGVTTAKDALFRNIHYECRGGADYALFVIKGIDYVVTIDMVFGQYATILCDGSSTSGSGHINIANIPYWLPLNGKMFYGNKNKPVSYSILECNVAAMRNNFPALFIGDAPSLCNAPPNCGYFKFAYWQRYIPR